MRKQKGPTLTMNKKDMLAALISLFGIIFLFNLIVSSKTTFADNPPSTSATDSITLNVAESCTLSGSGSDSHSATIRNGQYLPSIGSTTMTAFCNDNSGFSIYAIGYTNDEEGNNLLVDNSLGVDGIIKTGIVTGPGSNSSASAWSMKIGKLASSHPAIIAGSSEDGEREDGDPDYSSSQQIPNTHTRIAYRTSATGFSEGNDVLNGAVLTTSYSVYISNVQPAGVYSGKVKYTMLHPYSETIPEPKLYMQDLSLRKCQALASDNSVIAYDHRDENDYTIRFINGACWMTQNLRITDVVTPEESNFESEYDFDPCTSDLETGNSYNEAKCHDSGNTTTGVWYNYYSATASASWGDSSMFTVSQDICPSGWHLPAGGTGLENGSIGSLINYVNAFNPVTGGFYDYGTLSELNSGFWWSSAPDNYTRRSVLHYGNNSLGLTSINRGNGQYVRCVKTL